MGEDRVLRSRGKGRSDQVNTTTARTTEQTVTTNTIPPLMSLDLTQVPVTTQPTSTQRTTTQSASTQQSTVQNNTTRQIQNTSSPETNSTIRSPQYTSIAAQEIRQQFNALRLNQRVGDGNDTVISNDGLTLKEYVTASIGASQAAVMNQVKDSLQQTVPQIVREVLRAERNFSFDSIDHVPYEQPVRNYNNFHVSQDRPQNNQYQQHQQQLHAPMTTTYFQQKQCLPNELEKWGLKFDGSRKSFTVEDFVFRVESLQVDYNCPMVTLMKGFHHLLSGSAYEWFWTFRRENPYCEWTQLKFNLIRKFRRFESDTEIQRCIMERKHNPSESSEAFISEIITLKNQLSRSVREEELVKIVKDNLKDGLYQLIYPINIRSFDHLLDECKRAERIIAKRSNHRQFPVRRINEINYNQTEVDTNFEIEAIKANQPAKQLICWNCKKAGHSFVECSSEQRNLFCYKCGFEDVITPKCPRCTGNK